MYAHQIWVGLIVMHQFLMKSLFSSPCKWIQMRAVLSVKEGHTNIKINKMRENNSSLDY